MCQVPGGVTGTRQGFLKDPSGEVVEFEFREAAEKEARRRSEKRNASNGCASFRYWVEEVA
jgi:hypothetical protein